jgi:hypothetical protein
MAHHTDDWSLIPLYQLAQERLTFLAVIPLPQWWFYNSGPAFGADDSW